MNESIRQLEPKAIWNHFSDINAIPRASKKESRITGFIKNFGEQLGLETEVDASGNVLIKKPATAGMESRATVVLQSHLDMVHQKNSDSDFDFETRGIEMEQNGDWVKAKGTTLGADNGLGVASILTILAAGDIPHPALEALFTIDEETGMTGAKTLAPGWLSGKYLLNLDTEDDDELTIGCAGGTDVTADGSYGLQDTQGKKAFEITVKGLTGGHSGVDIHLGRGNANKIMNRLLLDLAENLEAGIISIHGGSLRNAIPRESAAVIVVNPGKEDALLEKVSAFQQAIKAENATTDPNLVVAVTATETTKQQADATFILSFLKALYACPNGIYRMTPGIEGLVQSSNNIAKVTLENGSFSVQNLTRSSVDSEKKDLVKAIGSAFELCGATITTGSDYPGWEPKPDALIVQVMKDTYKSLFREDLHVNAIHAGLECGIIGAHYPEMEMVSFGPTIKGAHSPDEKAQISSLQKFWKYLQEVLKNIPEKGQL